MTKKMFNVSSLDSATGSTASKDSVPVLNSPIRSIIKVDGGGGSGAPSSPPSTASAKAVKFKVYQPDTDTLSVVADSETSLTQVGHVRVTDSSFAATLHVTNS